MGGTSRSIFLSESRVSAPTSRHDEPVQLDASSMAFTVTQAAEITITELLAHSVVATISREATNQLTVLTVVAVQHGETSLAMFRRVVLPGQPDLDVPRRDRHVLPREVPDREERWRCSGEERPARQRDNGAPTGAVREGRRQGPAPLRVASRREGSAERALWSSRLCLPGHDLGRVGTSGCHRQEEACRRGHERIGHGWDEIECLRRDDGALVLAAPQHNDTVHCRCPK